jgi:hypothetical protein
MKARPGILTLLWLLLLGAAVPLHAQFTTYGCPAGPTQALNGFTAGTTAPSQICLTGTFGASEIYDVTLTDTNTGQQTTVVGTASTTSLIVTVPASFYATVSTPGQPDPVTIHISIPQVFTSGQNGTFQINPPLAAGGPVFVSAVNSAVAWRLFSGGTAPYEDEFNNGSVPNGMPNLPPSAIWPGTPNQTGVFQFSVIPTDSWGNEILANLAAYILPLPQVTSVNPTSAVVGSGTVALTLNGSGFVSPATIGSTPEPGSTVQVTAGASPPVTLTPTSFSANQLTVNLPASYLTAEGILQLAVSNLAVATSNPAAFPVNPTITALNPNIRTAGAPALTLTVTGAGFANGATVLMNQTALPTTFVNSTSLTATVPTIPTPGVEAITVVNPDQTYSAAANLTVAPAPTISALNPSSTAAGGPAFALTVTGSHFLQGMMVYFNSNPLPATLVPNQQNNMLVATVPAPLIASEGILPVSVSTVDGYYTANINFQVNPTITALSPNMRTVGTPAFTLLVTGTGFANGAAVLMNGSALPTKFVNSTSLTATVPTVNVPSQASIEVLNSDTTVSIAQPLTFVPAPAISSLKPGSVNAGGPAFTLLVTGAYFSQGMVVYFDANPLPATLVQNDLNNQLMVSVPAPDIAQAGTVPVWVTTADGYSTPSLPFTIVSTGPPPLQLQTFSPLPPGMVNTAYSTTFVASQGAGGYMFSVIGGTLPAGLALSPAGILSGTPTAYGPSQFTVQVADSAGNTVSRVFTLSIAPPPLTLTTGPLANTQVNTPISIQFAGSGGIPPYTFVEFGALPPGTSINSAGLLSGTPTKTGSYPFLVFLDDSTGASVSKSYSLNIALPGLLITQPSPLPSGQINVPYTTQLTATGGVGSPYTWSATGLPSGVTIANTTGLIAGIPRASGPFTIAVTVGDSSGTTATQNYALTIAPASLTFSGAPFSNGAVGIAFTSAVSVTGGAGPYTFTATGLPPGLTLSTTGTLSGTPATAGTFSIAVTATDVSGGTVSGSFSITIAQKLVVTAATIPNAVVGTAISAVQLTATGGTPPYQWQSATLPPGLSLALNGTLSGTPAAAGSFTFTVYAVDSNGVLASGTEQLTVGLPAATTPVSFTGLPTSAAPATQQSLTVSLGSPYPATVTVNLTLTFAPTSGADDPSIQFSTGGRTAQVTIPAGSTAGVTNVGVQTGTVAGTITITAQLLAGSTNVTPTPAPSTTIVVTPGAPVITGVTATRTSSGFTVTVTGYASNRDVDTATYLFSPSGGATLTTSQVSTPITSLFTQWYGTASSAPFGSQFTLTQPFNVNGSASSVLSVSVTLTNALGTSPAVSAILQ